MSALRAMPGWGWAVVALLCLSEPLARVWLQHGLAAGLAPTGFRIGDDPFFLVSMRAYSSSFASPYALCDSGLGPANWAYFALPHHHLYALIGAVASAVGVGHGLALGLVNALGGACYLLSAWTFFHTFAPLLARGAFAVFTLVSGFGGLVYVVARFLPLSLAAPESFLWLFARYELIEGPFLAPILVLPRLYYTLPLALGLLALVCRARGSRGASLGLLLVATLLNARVGPLVFGLAACMEVVRVEGGASLRARAVGLVPHALVVLLAMGAVALLFRQNPPAQENVAELLRRSAWFLPLLLAAPFGFAALAALVWVYPQRGVLRAVACALVGYLVAFAVGYVGHELYHGTLISAAGETAAAVAVSDLALAGAVAGALWAVILPARRGGVGMPWYVLASLGLVAVAISALGRGWALGLMPERCLAVLGVPLALCSADAFARLAVWRPRGARAVAGLALASGCVSMAVSFLCFQGPLGLRLAVDAPFAWTHSEAMAPADARLIAHMGEGVALAPASIPPLMGDVAVAANPGLRTVFGQPSLEFAGASMRGTALEVQRFFDAGTTDEARAELVSRWCVTYVYCPATRPVAASVVDALRALPWLSLVAEEGGAAVFRVLP